MEVVATGACNDVYYRATACKLGVVVANLYFEFADTFEIRKYFHGADRLIAVVQAVDHESVETASRSGSNHLRSGALRLIAVALRANATHRTRIRSGHQKRQLREVSAV